MSKPTSAAAPAEQTAESAVEVSDLSFVYPKTRGSAQRRALDGVSFRITSGETFAFLGPNGGGKSTLFRLLTTAVPVAQGSLRIFGHDPNSALAEIRSQLGVVFQSPSLDPHLSVRENLAHHGHLYGLRGSELETRIADALTRLRLSDRASDRVSTLSGGLARRTEIAKSLLHRPRLLLLDEPSTGLDPGARRDLWNTLDELRGDGLTVVMTTHFMEEADRCERLALLDKGRIAAEGTPEALKAEIGGDMVTLEAESDSAELMTSLTALIPDIRPITTGDLVRFEHSRAHETVAQIGAALGSSVRSISIARPTLEDVFLRYTGHSLFNPTEQPSSEAIES